MNQEKRSDAKNLTEKEALKIAQVQLQQEIPNDPLVVLKEKTIERPFGWVFFFITKEQQRSKNIQNGLPGLGPVVVERDTGRVHSLRPSAHPEQVISEFEKTLPKEPHHKGSTRPRSER